MDENMDDYELLDSGNERRLERFGKILLDRPAPQAFWKPGLPQARWDQAHATYERSSKGGGSWRTNQRFEKRFTITIGGVRVVLDPTGFGHVGIFPEQCDNWRLITQRIRACLNENSGPVEVMNLFGYTGLATLVALDAGATVCHVDSSKGVVAWARENAEASGLKDRPVRWIVEDAVKYLKREHKRGRRYRGLIFDPPAFGRGNKGEVWKIERDLSDLLDHGRQVLDARPDFVLLSTYSPKFTPEVLGNVMDDAFGDLPGSIVSAEMSIPESGRDRRMPNGVTARWLARRPEDHDA